LAISEKADHWESDKAEAILTQIKRLFPCSHYQGYAGVAILVSRLTHAVQSEGFEMFRRKGLLCSAGRSVAVATIAVLAFTMAEPPMAAAGSLGAAGTGVSTAAPSSGATDFSARRRYYRGGNAAGLAMMGLMIGTIGAAIAAQQRNDYYYYGPGYYGYAPGYVYGPPAYYGYGPYYGRRYYRYYPY
jgi:hypothetical protein